MDEVDIDNVEDLNELEARLYAQIHHEATDKPLNSILTNQPQQTNDGLNNSNNNNDDGGGVNSEQNYETSSNTNRILSKRYWASGEHAVKQQQPQQNTNHRYIRNPFKALNQKQNKDVAAETPAVVAVVTPNQKQSKEVAETPAVVTVVTPSNNSEANADAGQNNMEEIVIDEPPAIITTKPTNPTQPSISEIIKSVLKKPKKNKKNPNKMDQNITQQKPTTDVAAEKTNMKINPVADWMQRNKNKKSNTNAQNPQKKTSSNNAASTSTTKQQSGPFAKQKQKLDKAKRLEEKKQKSKKAKNSAAAMAKQAKPLEIIDLDTENDSDSSDVVMIPIAPTPTFTVDDSDEDKEEEDSKESIELVESIIVEHEENAIDSTDVQMSTTSSFIKPQEILHSTHITTASGADKQLDNSSRCTSPCSIQSSDDFIGQIDRSRLLTNAGAMADDEDLLVLTSDINSLLEATETIGKRNDNVEEHLETSLEHVDISNDSPEFLTPSAAAANKDRERQKDYRVDQSQFRAVDVYESESDKTDSVYSKGAAKTTVIRQIDASSDDDIEDISSSLTQRTKRLRKRRASSSNKESESGGNNNNTSSDNDDDNEDNDADDDNDLLRTAIPFIARGPAVERCKPRKRSRTLSSQSPTIPSRKSAKLSKTAANAHMSDGEFIATLNNLVQGQDSENDKQEPDDSDGEPVPTARDIAEKILTAHAQKTTTNNETFDSDMAVPDEVYNELDKVFESIDHMDDKLNKKNSSSTMDESVNISDSSDSNPEKHLLYKSLPNEEDHIITYVKDATSNNRVPEKKRAENGSPIYNVIYSRTQRNTGGIGWNEEMRKFYNESWNGENFVLKRVLQKMNPDKSLWKIYSEDRFNIKPNRRYNMKCTNCCEFGHMRSKCKLPRKPLICYMCGDSGHLEPRCPNTICLRCGNKTQVFTKSCNSCSFQNRLICPICKIRGHSLDFCPDKWRRYHSTTEPNAYPNNTVNYNPKKYCCICGGRGHLSDNCRSAVRFMEYPIILSTIKSYQKSYEDLPVKSSHVGIGFNLMYEPCQEFKFDLVDRTTNDKYYGRFLNAVGLEFMLKRKRRVNTVTKDTDAKQTKRLSKKYVANPYSKVGCASQKDTSTEENAPNQVQEISESCNLDDSEDEENQAKEIISLDENTVDDNDIELVDSSTVDHDKEMTNIQLNTINVATTSKKSLVDENFKSPTSLTSSVATSVRAATEPPHLIMDSDSNYSFSEHYDVPSTAANEVAELVVTDRNETESMPRDEVLDSPPNEELSFIPLSEVSIQERTQYSRPKPREMEALPDFIPLTGSNEDDLDEEEEESGPVVGISNKFIAAMSDDDMDENIEQSRRSVSPLPEIPCEAKIYLTHFHSKYLLSPDGHNFLVKTSKVCKLKARLDFTSIGHVLVIFGLPSDQNKFQRELLLKYRELTDQCNQKQLQITYNVPKKADVLVRFLRDNITQLLNNLGNVNQLLKRLKYLENQQSKSGFKLAEKVRRSMNMILIGQAGLQDGSMHLDKLLLILKTLVNEYADEDVAPPELRVEITDHWKMIFTPYRHDNYQKMVETYNRLISKNRVPKLSIDPILLGQKVLDTTLTTEQKQKLEQPKPLKDNTEQANKPAKALKESSELAKAPAPPNLNTKNSKHLKRKQSSGGTESPPPPAPSSKLKTNKSRDNSPSKAPPPPKINSETSNKTKATPSTPKATSTNTTKPQKLNSPTKIAPPPKITSDSSNTTTPNKQSKTLTTMASTKSHTSSTGRLEASKTSTPNKTKTAPTTTTSSSVNTNTKKQQQKIMPPPPFANPEKRSTVSTTIQQVTDKWKSDCDHLLSEISGESTKKTNSSGGGSLRDSKLPSTFWSRESLRYLDQCMRLASSRPNIVEKLQRVQNKSQNGQLSYNDYLAVIKLHTALNGK